MIRDGCNVNKLRMLNKYTVEMREHDFFWMSIAYVGKHVLHNLKGSGTVPDKLYFWAGTSY